MSKRKREEDCKDLKMRKEDNLSSETSNREDGDMNEEDISSQGTEDDPPISRKQLYSEAFQELRSSQETIRRARRKIEQLLDDSEDFHCMEAMSCIDEASNQLDEALTSLQQSSKHWVSFLAMPEVPMRRILKYLKFKDKANFRLSSQEHRDIVDKYDKDFKSVKLDLYKLQNCPKEILVSEMLATGKDIKLKCSDLKDFNDDLLCEISAMLIELKARPEMINRISRSDKIENIYLVGEVLSRGTMISLNKFENSLKVLYLGCIDLSELKDQRFSLPHLENLQLDYVTGFSGFIQLLASSSSSLKQISLDSIKGDDWNFSNVNQSEIVLKKLMKIRISRGTQITGVFNLLKIASKSLKVLCLENVENPEKSQLDFSLPVLERINIRNSNSDYLSILACSAPRLNSFKLDRRHGSQLFTNLQLNPVTRITKIEIIHCYNEACKKILAAVADSVQEMDLTFVGIEEGELANNFPKLTSLRTKHCAASFTREIVRRSPCLKDLDVDNGCSEGQVLKVLGHTNLKRLEKLTLEYSFDKIELPKLEKNQLKLTKLSLYISSCAQGMHDLLNACGSTLEELCISRSFADERLNLQGLQTLKVLKRLTIDILDKIECQYIFSPDCLHQLLKQSSKSLEKLVLRFPECLQYNENLIAALNNHLMTLDMNLPNLKILHIYPRPADYVVKQILRQLPKKVTFWSFFC